MVCDQKPLISSSVSPCSSCELNFELSITESNQTFANKLSIEASSVSFEKATNLFAFCIFILIGS